MVTIEDSYEEVYQILTHLKINEYEKIPTNIVSYYKTHRNKNYKFMYDYSKGYNEQLISKNSLKILYKIYYNYILSDTDKKKFVDILKLKEKTKQTARNNENGKTNIFSKSNMIEQKNSDIFSNKSIKIEPKNNFQEENKENNKLTKYEENIFTKIKNIILKILHFR